ncbi:ABC transporter substrate-binding protein [Clostridia bacterium]|nr:ABC transporter substrate-binding protein [Clostridia bacterium]
MNHKRTRLTRVSRLSRTAALTLALIMLLPMLTGYTAWAESTETVQPDVTPDAVLDYTVTGLDAPLDLIRVYTMMGLDMESGRDWRTHAFFTAMREKTGVDFIFRQYTDAASYQTAKDTAFASGDLPDVFFKGSFSPEEELKYRAAGQLIDLAPLLEESAPTLSGILNARADWRKSITHPDGSIAALPSLNGYERQCYIWINQTWLTALNLPMPSTFAEFTETLAAFRDSDPNGNNRKDEVPLSFVGPWEAKFFLHAFGLTPNDYNIYVDESGQVRYAPFESGYREFVEAIRDLKLDALLDSNAFRQGQTQRSTLLTEAKENSYGAFVSIAPYTLLSTDLSAAYSIMPPLAPADGTAPTYRRLLSGVVQGTFAITSKCEDPAALLRWVDYLYTDEGGRLAMAGAQDIDYSWNGSSWNWITDDFTPIETVLRDRVIRTDNLTPGLSPADFERRTELALEVRVRREGDAVQSTLVTPFPHTWPTDAAREDEIASLQLALGAAVDVGIARFVDGETELNDETWAAFQNELQDKGAERLVALFQSLYDEQR